MKKRKKKEDILIKISAGMLIAVIAMLGLYFKVSNDSEKTIFNGDIGEFYSEGGLFSGTGGEKPFVEKAFPEVNNVYYNNETKISTTYYDGDGIYDLIYARIIIDENIILTNYKVEIDYYPDLDKLIIFNGTDNSQSVGECIIGERKVIENENVQVDCSNTNKIISGNNLTINWVLSFKNSMNAESIIYPYAKDKSNNRNWTEGGTLSLIAYSSNNNPTLGQFIPSSGESYPNQEINFNYGFLDLDGAMNFIYGALMISINGSDWPISPVWINYYPDSNLIEIMNDSDNSFSQGNCTPGASKIIENRNAKIDCSKINVWKFANNLTIELKLSFKESAIGKNYSFYPYGKDWSSKRIYENKANWTIKPIPPNVAPNPESTSQYGTLQTKRKINFMLTYSDLNGGNDIIYTGFIIENNLSAANKKIWIDYDVNRSFIELRNGKNNSIIEGNCTSGENSIIYNSYAEIDCSQSSKSSSGNNIYVNLNILLKDNLTGNWTIFMKANDSNLSSGWKEINKISVEQWNLTCNDSDDGLDYYEAGDAKGTNGEFMDYCINSTSVREYYCNQTTKEVESKIYKCSYRCSSRKCIDSSTTTTTTTTANTTTEQEIDQTDTYTSASPETTDLEGTAAKGKTTGEIVLLAIIWSVVVLFLIVFIYFIYSLNKKRVLRRKVSAKPSSPVIRQVPPGYYRQQFRR